jgi:hypothetical protein
MGIFSNSHTGYRIVYAVEAYRPSLHSGGWVKRVRWHSLAVCKDMLCTSVVSPISISGLSFDNNIIDSIAILI